VVEARDPGGLVCGRDGGLVEGGVGGVIERGGRETLMVVGGSVPDECGTRGMVLRSGWKMDLLGRLGLIVAVVV
jgi:hypothetical protein